MKRQRRGVVEMLAERINIRFAMLVSRTGEPRRVPVDEELAMQPRFLQTTAGSTEFAALETSMEDLARAKRCEVAQFVR